MNKLLTSGMAALTLVGTGLAAAPASAHDWDGYSRHDNDTAGYVIAGGLIGLALGAALASNHHHYDRYHDGYYGYNGDYGRGRYYRYNGYSGYNGYNNYSGYGYSQPYYGNGYGYQNGYDPDHD